MSRPRPSISWKFAPSHGRASGRGGGRGMMMFEESFNACAGGPSCGSTGADFGAVARAGDGRRAATFGGDGAGAALKRAASPSGSGKVAGLTGANQVLRFA